MKELTEGLNIRFNIVIQSISEREFYQSLYYYYDFFHRTPELIAIFNDSQREYSIKHSKLWENRHMTDEEADEASAQTTKLERFNLYAVSATILVRIYWPIDDYRNTEEPDKEQDPFVVMLLRGVDYAKSLNRWKKDTFRGYSSWFDGKRSEYEKEFRRLHLIFLEELSKRKLPMVKAVKKESFVFDIKTGQFRYKKVKGVLSPKSREYEFIKTLYISDSHQSSYEDLNQGEKVSEVTKITLTETVKSVKIKFGILPSSKASNLDIIKNVSKYGYRLDI